MKKTLISLSSVIIAGLLFTGCNKAPSLSSQEKALFESSSPEIKQLFETALTADKANNYLSACTNYQALLHQNLSVDQVMAMQTAMSSLTQRIYDAAAKGDPGAKAAVDALKGASARQGR